MQQQQPNQMGQTHAGADSGSANSTRRCANDIIASCITSMTNSGGDNTAAASAAMPMPLPPQQQQQFVSSTASTAGATAAGSSGFPFSLPDLERLAEQALLNENSDARNSAAAQLRILSTYDEWDNVRALLNTAESPYLLFIVAKAFHFIVSNEIGPQERTEVQDQVLRVLSTRGAAWPGFVRRPFYSVYAAALYLNWRLTVIQFEDSGAADNSSGNENGGAGSKSNPHDPRTSVGAQVEQKLTSWFPPIVVVECMSEVLNHFAREDARSALMSIRTSFATTVLPHFFDYGARHLETIGEPAASLCCLALDYVPPTYLRPLVSLRLTSEDTIYVSPFHVWFPAMRTAAEFCETRVLGGPDDSLSSDDPLLYERCVQILKFFSCVAFAEATTDSSVRDDVQSFVAALINVAEQMILKFRVSRDTVLLEAGTGIMVNLFERNEEPLSMYIFANPNFVEEMSKVAIASSTRWDPAENTSRSSLMRLFYLIIEKAIPPPLPSCDMRTGDDFRASQMKSFSTDVFVSYFESALGKAHLPEDSMELRCNEGFSLNSEEYLQPLASMLFCESMSFLPIIEQAFEDSIRAHDICVRLRTGGAGVTDEEMTSVMVMCCDATCLMDVHATKEETILVVTHVVLSRLSMIVSLIGMGLRSRTMRKCLMEEMLSDMELLRRVVKFCTTFLEAGDDMTDELLACLSLASTSGDASGGDTSAAGSGFKTERKLHIGIVRSMFYFCICVLDTAFCRQRFVTNIVVELVCFVLVKHSDCIPLVSDTNVLMSKIIMDGTGQTLFFSSDRFVSLVRAHFEGDVTLISSDFICSSDEVQSCRTTLLKNLMVLLEQRQMIGLDTGTISEKFIDCATSTLAVDPSSALRDMIAVVGGIEYGYTLRMAMNWVIFRNGLLEPAAAQSANVHDLLLALQAALCERAFLNLECDNTCDLQWRFAHHVFLSVYAFLARLKLTSTDFTSSDSSAVIPRHSVLVGVNATQGEFGFVPMLSVDTPASSGGGAGDDSSGGSSLRGSDYDPVYSVSAILHSVCGGSWVNLGVMIRYEELVVNTVLLGAVEALMAVNPGVLMGNTNKRDSVFRAIYGVIQFPFPSQTLEREASRRGIWSRLAQYLTSCLGFKFAELAVRSIVLIFQKTQPEEIPSQIVRSAFREMCVLLCTQSMTEESLSLVCLLISTAHARDNSGCELVLEDMLSFASAYHRVRLRSLLMMVRDPPPNIAASFISIFGITTKVGVLAAW